jgi:hypothetical protein
MKLKCGLIDPNAIFVLRRTETVSSRASARNGRLHHNSLRLFERSAGQEV